MTTFLGKSCSYTFCNLLSIYFLLWWQHVGSCLFVSYFRLSFYLKDYITNGSWIRARTQLSPVVLLFLFTTHRLVNLIICKLSRVYSEQAISYAPNKKKIIKKVQATSYNRERKGETRKKDFCQGQITYILRMQHANSSLKLHDHS